jgi:hypothetical protein
VLINHYFEAPIEDMYKALGKAVGPAIWFQLDWRGHAPTPAQERAQEEAKKKAMKDALETERKLKTKGIGTQTEDVDVEAGPSFSKSSKNDEGTRPSRRFSESDIGDRNVKLDYFD